ncbi:MAG TPA: fructosamine kinase family protein [Bacteroidia bacterium]|nr:fructosamine kinase family protein [Bacteroidia bacterium]
MLTTALKQTISEYIPGFRSNPESDIKVTPVSGGSINNSYTLQAEGQQFFIKTNHTSVSGDIFKREWQGIELLRTTDTIPLPLVYGTGVADNKAFLLMEWIASGRRTGNFFELFGRALAMLHKNSAASFGLSNDNYIGTLVQSNCKHRSGADFFVHERLEPMVRMATDTGIFNPSDSKMFQDLYRIIPEIIPEEPPSLLHGDLWSGNFMTGPDGTARLIDPAVYYGHREADLAMTRLFGGFDSSFYAAYNDAFPLEYEWENRVPLFNLYPLLVHLNLFGKGYLQPVRNALQMVLH